MFDLQAFLEKVRLVKKDYHIKRVKRGSDRSQRRITILVINEYLKEGGNIHKAFYLEANLYRSLRKENLTCDPTEEEIRLQDAPRRKDKKIKHFNPLKLVSENFDTGGKQTYPLTKKIINILKEDKSGLPTDNTRRRAFKTFKHIQKDTRLFKKQARLSLYQANKV